MASKPLDREYWLKLERDLRAIDVKTRYNQLASYNPYPKQIAFHDLGSCKRERLLMAANRVGKSFCGAAELAMHLTGLYPDWWLGRRFTRPIKAWASSDTGLTTRDIVQTKLCGPYSVVDLQGAGAIPRGCVKWDKDVSLARGVTGLYDTLLVTHVTDGVAGGKSILTLKSYEQGRKKWQGDAVDVVWYDEEPPDDIYNEGLTRTAPTRVGEASGIVYLTFTPLEGRSAVVTKFMDMTPDDPAFNDRAIVTMILEDAQHISPEEQKKMIAGYSASERDARAKGIPSMGSGKIFEFPEEAIRTASFEPPRHWSYLWGLDFGIRHPFAAVLLGWDKDADVIYVMKCLRMKDTLPLQHVAAMKPVLRGAGNRVPAAWPQDGWQREEFDGKLEPLAKIYKAKGQRMIEHHATFDDGSNSTEAGVMEMQERFQTKRLLVFAECGDWFDEYRYYHRKDGKIVKLQDDLMSATRVGVMAKRMARPVLFVPTPGEQQGGVAKGGDFDWNWWS
jgi:phage terminase large subunit-like protein